MAPRGEDHPGASSRVKTSRAREWGRRGTSGRDRRRRDTAAFLKSWKIFTIGGQTERHTKNSRRNVASTLLRDTKSWFFAKKRIR
jgi:hypothetical protein